MNRNKHLVEIPIAVLEEKIAQKAQLLNKRVQDKKTQEIFEDENLNLEDIQNILEISEEAQGSTGDSCISVMATMKSIAHTIQSKARWQQYAKDHNIMEEIQTFSSKGDFKKLSQIAVEMASPKHPKHIVMCTHLTRIYDLLELARYLTTINGELKRPRKLRIYLDEFDKYVDKMRPIVNNLVLLDCVDKVIIVTATPDPIWTDSSDGWKQIFVLNPVVPDAGDTYLNFSDCNHFMNEDLAAVIPATNHWLQVMNEEGWDGNDKKLIRLHHRIILEYPDIIMPGRVIFAPGNITRVSHNLVARFWNHSDFNCSVIVINGERTGEGFYGYLYLSGERGVKDVPHMRINMMRSPEMQRHFSSKSPEEKEGQAQLNEIFADLWHYYNLGERPLVITGRLCVERAQTLVHPEWGTFTDAIYYKHSSPEDAYQQQRQLGHVKKWSTYRGVPRVFCPDVFRQDVLILEKRATEFSRRYNNRLATRSDYIDSALGDITQSEAKEKEKMERAKEREAIIEGPCFKTLDKVNEFLSKVLGSQVRISGFHTVDGYQLSTRLNAHYKKRKEQLLATDRLTKKDYQRIPKGLNISSKTGQAYMVYPVYDTLESTECKYYVRYLPPRVAAAA